MSSDADKMRDFAIWRQLSDRDGKVDSDEYGKLQLEWRRRCYPQVSEPAAGRELRDWLSQQRAERKGEGDAIH